MKTGIKIVLIILGIALIVNASVLFVIARGDTDFPARAVFSIVRYFFQENQRLDKTGFWQIFKNSGDVRTGVFSMYRSFFGGDRTK